MSNPFFLDLTNLIRLVKFIIQNNKNISFYLEN